MTHTDIPACFADATRAAAQNALTDTKLAAREDHRRAANKVYRLNKPRRAKRGAK